MRWVGLGINKILILSIFVAFLVSVSTLSIFVANAIILDPTKTTLSPNPGAVAIGATITLHAKVIDSNSTTKTIPHGTVSWSDGGAGGSFNATSCQLSQYSTSISTSICAIVYTPQAKTGIVTINGTYSGDSTHKISSGTSALNVTSHPPTTTIITTSTFRSTPLVISHGDLLQINSGATLTMASSLDNNGTINIMSGGTLKIEPGHATTNHVGGVININGTLISPGGYGFCCTGWSTITNDGKINNRSFISLQSTSTLTNDKGAEFNNYNHLHLQGGATFSNAGKLNNLGSWTTKSGLFTLSNSGEFNNTGGCSCPITNTETGRIDNRGPLVGGADGGFDLINYGLINNQDYISDVIYNYKGGTINNDYGGGIDISYHDALY